MKFFSKYFSFCVVLFVATQNSVAAEAPEYANSNWATVDMARARLIAAKTGTDGAVDVTLGIHIQLKDGWKTYWRSPGDSGIAPSFNWQGSKNIESTEVLWPVPAAFDSFGFLTWGYETEILFPVKITLKNPDKALRAALSFNYGVCKEVCVPITQRFVLSLPNIDAANSNEIQIFNRYISLIPSSYSPTAVARSVVIKQGATNMLHVVAATSSRFKAPVLILEGEDGDFFTVKNTNVSNDRQKVEFVIEADFIRRRASHVGRKLTATVIDNGMSAEGVVSIN